jgi:hypothetical protein
MKTSHWNRLRSERLLKDPPGRSRHMGCKRSSKPLATFTTTLSQVARLIRWQADHLASVALPFSIPLARDLAKTVNRMQCHRRVVEVFASVFAQVKSSGLESQVSSFGGCFAFRQQRTGARLSTHCWGIAIDLNPASNAQGMAGDMNAGLVDIFRGAGFEWGGDWPGKIRDGMHFQFCSGY